MNLVGSPSRLPRFDWPLITVFGVGLFVHLAAYVALGIGGLGEAKASPLRT